MSDLSPPGTARRSTDDWAGVAGQRWLADLAPLEGMTAPIAAALIERAAFRPGQRVIDVGCGGGRESLRIAGLVGPEGEVLGLDVSPALVDAAVHRGSVAGLSNLQFEVGDAETWQPATAPYDRLISHFGTLYFHSPGVGYANLARLLRPGGRADLAVWGPIAENPWASDVLGCVADHVGLDAPLPRVPGPFCLDDPDYVAALLGGAGFRLVEVVPWSGPLWIGGQGLAPEAALQFLFRILQLDRLLAARADADRQAVTARIREVLSSHRVGDGVNMRAMAWLVTARR